MRKDRLEFRRRFSDDPSFLELVIVIVLAAFAVILALSPWLILAIVGGIVANALGHNPWLGVGVVGLFFLVRQVLR